MEVLRQPEPAMMFMHQGGNSRAATLYPHHTPKMLTCYGFDATTLAASRTPTSEHRAQSCSPHSPPAPSPPAPCPSSCASPPSSSSPCSSGALYSVLMGRVPKAYSLMASSPPNSSSAFPPSSSSSSSSSYAMPSAAVSTAPCHERMEEDDAQTEPMDLSCKRPNFPSSSAFSSSSSSSSCHSQQGHEFSLLRELLCKGKGEQPPSSSSSTTTFSSAASTSSSSPYSSGISGSVSPARSASSPRCDSPDSEKSSDSFFSRPAAVVTGSTRVTLAKKNMFPVCSRVSDLLYKVIHFTKSIPEFMTLSHNDKITLILNSWSKLLLLFMAEGNFHFVVTPIFSSEQNGGEQDSNPSAGEPTMRGVENIQAFLRKCQQMNLDGKEYAFLKMLVLFNSSYVGLDRPDQVEQLNSVVQHLLKQHVDSRGLEDFMHFSKLLLGLPSLYSIDSKMVENLFCKHIAKSADMEVLLKEMLQSEQ